MDIGRKAVITASPIVREQHLVSRVLLRQFCEPNAKDDDKLLAHSLQYGKSRLTGPGGVAKRDHFVKIDSKETEHVWGLVEQELPKALSAERTSRILGDPELVAVLKDTCRATTGPLLAVVARLCRGTRQSSRQRGDGARG